MLEAMEAELFNIKKLITCPICLDVLSLPTSTPCEHVFCKDCLQEALTHRAMCPLCGQKVGKKQIKEQTHLTHIFQLFGELVQAVEAEKEVEQMQAPVPSNPFAAATAATETPIVGPPIPSEPVVLLHSLERSRSLEEVVFPVGSLVNVLPRTWAGMNKLGGVGWVEAEAADDEYGRLYAVKYVLDGKRDDDVPAAFVERYQELGRQSRRSSPIERSNERASKQPRRFSASDVHSSSSSGGLRAVGDGKENDPLPAASSSNSNARNRKIVIITTGIESKYNIDQKLEQFVTMTDNVSLSCGFTDAVSHLVVSTDKNNLMKQRTMKYMQALAKGIWIVSTRWLEDSIAAGQVLGESAYEVRGNIKAIVEQAPHRARRNKQKKGNALLSGYNVLLYGVFPLPGPARSDMEFLLENCGARVFTVVAQYTAAMTAEDWSINTQVILCSNENYYKSAAVHHELLTCTPPAVIADIPVVSAVWLMDTVTNFSSIPFDNYLLAV